MSAIASTDVTYTMLNKKKDSAGYNELNFTVAFGNGTLTYPTGGIPLLAASLGCPSEIRSLTIVDPGHANGFIYKYDATNNKIVMYQTPDETTPLAGTPLTQVPNTATPAAVSLQINIKGW